MFLMMILSNSVAGMFRNSVQYYWSSNIRESASAFSGIAVFFAVFGFIFVGSGIFMFYLDMKGKVCTECKLIYPKSTITCFKCKNNIAYAKSIMDYRAELTDVGTPTTSTNISYPPVQNNISNINREKFCTSCGLKIKGTDHFCPRCGTKN